VADPVIVAYHLPASSLAGLGLEVDARSAPPFSGGYRQLGAGVVRPLGTDGPPVVLVGFSEGAQAVRAHVAAGDMARVIGVVQLDGAHGSRPPAAYQLEPWRTLRASKIPTVYTSSRIPVEGAIVSTRELLQALGWPTTDGRHVIRPGLAVWNTPGTDAAEHRRHAGFAADAVRQVLAGGASSTRGPGVVLAAAAVWGVAKLVGWF